MSSAGVDPVPDLASALAGLEAAALAARLDPGAARVEGERLAAAVAEATSGAAADWNKATGRSGTQPFFDAASQGRRWRASPTRLLSRLVGDAPAQAPRYAEALATVCAAAAQLGVSNARVLGNASVAASSQLGAVRAGGGSTFDLGPDAAPGPGAFPGLGEGPVLKSVSDTYAPPTSTAPAAPPAPAAAPDEPAASPGPEPEPKSLEELLAELDSLTGLTEVKAEIHRQVALLRVEKLRTEAGLRAPTLTRHLVFVGNPGTGKTTVARLVGGIYRALGLLSKGQLVEVDRSELVAGYLGQTAMKTSEVVASAVGGVLFIDEAYSLAGDQYGTEAVDTLVKEMEDHRDDLVLIVAGYPDPMVVFIGQNPGLSSRFRTTIEFTDYSDAELVDIFTALARNADYDVSEECLTRFRTILAVTPRGPAFGNGRFARNQLEAAIGHHAWRLRDVVEPTLAQLRELVADDLDGPAPKSSEPVEEEPA